MLWMLWKVLKALGVLGRRGRLWEGFRINMACPLLAPADEFSDPNPTPLPLHRGTQYIARRCCPTSSLPQCSLVVLTLNVRLAKPTLHKQPAQHNVFGQEVHVRPPIALCTVLGANSSVELFPVSHSKKGDYKPT